MALVGTRALSHCKAIVEYGILECRKITCQREWRFLGFMFRKGTLFVPAVLNVGAASLNKMLRQSARVALSGVTIASIGPALQILVHKAKQTIVGYSVAAVGRCCQEEHMPFAFCGKALKQTKALVLATFIADAGMRLIDNDEGRASSGKIVPATVSLYVIEADDSKRICLEQALRCGQAPFEAPRSGCTHGYSVDIKLLAKLADPLIDQVRRTQHGKAVNGPAVQPFAQEHARVKRRADTDVVSDQKTGDRLL